MSHVSSSCLVFCQATLEEGIRYLFYQKPRTSYEAGWGLLGMWHGQCRSFPQTVRSHESSPTFTSGSW